MASLLCCSPQPVGERAERAGTGGEGREGLDGRGARWDGLWDQPFGFYDSIAAAAAAAAAGPWAETCGVCLGGGLVVRPDGHVAWRSVSSPKFVQ